MPLTLEEYAASLEDRIRPRLPHITPPEDIKAKLTALPNMKAVLWDVYGTLMAVDTGDLGETLKLKHKLIQAFELTIQEFNLKDTLLKLTENPAEYLLNRYVRLIEEDHQRERERGVQFPEVKIEAIWQGIIRELQTAGYTYDGAAYGPLPDFSIKMAYFFDYVFHGKRFYPGVKETLISLKNRGHKQGLISNAQFYTPIQLDRLLAAGTSDKEAGFRFLFDRELICFSYLLGVAKPNPLIFEKAALTLRKYNIDPVETAYVGNDVFNDLLPAHKQGFKTVLFAGDGTTLKLRKDHPSCRDFIPDAIINKIPQIKEILVFSGL
ncbi:HAD family hydrolase [candidate division KSB1 bacterium]|nr:HAD family hydrolase [candidate division KSB1 bacterium]